MSKEVQDEELVELEGKRMYPEVAQYFRAQQAAERAKEVTQDDLAHAFRKAEREARYAWQDSGDRSVMQRWDSYTWRRRNAEWRVVYDKYTEDVRATDNAYTQAMSAARDLLRNSPHAEVKWIEANALNSEPGYSHTVLKALPVKDPQELWDLKHQHGMCGEFDRLFNLAEAEGVFSGGVKQHGARELAAFRNWVSRNYGDRYAQDTGTQLRNFIKAVREGYEADLAAAKAEWQGLDEAWRSERSRRAAATRRSNAEQESLDTQAEVVSEDTSVEGDTPSTPAVKAEEDTRDPFAQNDRPITTPALRVLSST